MPVGRPRTFDPDVAIDKAVEVFWRHGYEGTSMADLTSAMGMNRPSVYDVFGTKEDLFRKAVARYAERDMAYARAALDQPTAFEVAQAFLRDNALALFPQLEARLWKHKGIRMKPPDAAAAPATKPQ